MWKIDERPTVTSGYVIDIQDQTYAYKKRPLQEAILGIFGIAIFIFV